MAVVRVMVAAVVTSLSKVQGKADRGNKKRYREEAKSQGGFVIFLTDRYLNEEQKVVS